MYNTLKLLIEKKYYTNKADIVAKVDTFYALNKITTEEYVDLTMLIEQYYPSAEVAEVAESAEEVAESTEESAEEE